jgi:hypothetical protein
VRNAQAGALFQLEASYGVTYFDQSGPFDIEELSAASDAALYQNKERRRRLRAPSDLHAQEERR